MRLVWCLMYRCISCRTGTLSSMNRPQPTTVRSYGNCCASVGLPPWLLVFFLLPQTYVLLYVLHACLDASDSLCVRGQRTPVLSLVSPCMAQPLFPAGGFIFNILVRPSLPRRTFFAHLKEQHCCAPLIRVINDDAMTM